MQWDGRHDPFEAAIRKETTCCAAGKSQNETFDEQLANELAASGTNRGAHGNFFFAGSGASEKQVGHVAASDQEQHGDRADQGVQQDRKSTRLNSSHGYISYAVFCLKKKKH